MKERVRYAVGAVLFLLLSQSNAYGDLQEIKKAGRIRILVCKDEHPGMFNYRDKGEPGFERELLTRWAALQKLSLELVVTDSYAERIPLLREQKGDLIGGIIRSEEREKIIGLSAEILPVRHVVVTLKPAKISWLGAFTKCKVGVLKDTTMALKTIEAGVPKENIQYFESLDAILAAMKSGTITATVLVYVDYILLHRDNPEVAENIFLGEAGSSCWGVRKEDQQLLASLNQYINAVRSTPTWSQLIVKYYGEDTLRALGKR